MGAARTALAAEWNPLASSSSALIGGAERIGSGMMRPEAM
jgi:hypothetical protein